jgi:hypothetical protein
MGQSCSQFRSTANEESSGVGNLPVIQSRRQSRVISVREREELAAFQREINSKDLRAIPEQSTNEYSERSSVLPQDTGTASPGGHQASMKPTIDQIDERNRPDYYKSLFNSLRSNTSPTEIDDNSTGTMWSPVFRSFSTKGNTKRFTYDISPSFSRKTNDEENIYEQGTNPNESESARDRGTHRANFLRTLNRIRSKGGRG